MRTVALALTLLVLPQIGLAQGNETQLGGLEFYLQNGSAACPTVKAISSTKNPFSTFPLDFPKGCVRMDTNWIVNWDGSEAKATDNRGEVQRYKRISAKSNSYYILADLDKRPAPNMYKQTDFVTSGQAILCSRLYRREELTGGNWQFTVARKSWMRIDEERGSCHAHKTRWRNWRFRHLGGTGRSE